MGDTTYFWDLGDLEDWIAKISGMDSDDRQADAPRG